MNNFFLDDLANALSYGRLQGGTVALVSAPLRGLRTRPALRLNVIRDIGAKHLGAFQQLLDALLRRQTGSNIKLREQVALVQVVG